MKIERKFLIGGAVALVAFLVFLLRPRPFRPPILGLGEPVWQGPFGATNRYTYSIPGNYDMFAQAARNQLAFRGYKQSPSFWSAFSHPDGSAVAIFQGRWQPGPGSDGQIAFAPGWITVTCDTPPDSWRQFWFKLTLPFKKKHAPAVTRYVLIQSHP